MADITMCRGEMCAKKDTCYRYTAPINEYRQAFFIVPPINRLSGECEHYWEITDGSNQ